MSREQAWFAFVVWSAGVGIWGLSWLLYGGWWRAAFIMFSVCGLAWTIRELVRGKR